MTLPRWLSPVVLVFSFITLASPSIAQAQPPRAVVPPTGERVLRSWQDSVKIDGGEQERTVEVVYDYDAGVSMRRIYDADGTLLAEQVLASQPQPSREEIEEAVALLRNDASLGALSRQAGAKFDGGFILEEAKGEPCGPGTRCIQVFILSQSRWGLLRHTAVNIRGARVAHRSFRPGEKK